MGSRDESVGAERGTMGVPVSSDGVRWAAFIADLQALVPGFPSHPTGEYDITSHGLLDHAQRVALRRAASRMSPGLSPSAVAACTTLADVYAAMGDFTPAQRPVRGENRSSDVALRPLQPSDYAAIYQASLDPSENHRWRYRGRTPSPEAFQESLYADVLAQFAAVRVPTGEFIGLVSSYGYRADVGSCYYATLRCPDERHRGGGEMMSASKLFLDYLFVHFNLRRVYLEIPEFNQYLVKGMVGTLLHHECTMTEQLWHGGRYWAMQTYRIGRPEWEKFASASFAAS